MELSQTSSAWGNRDSGGQDTIKKFLGEELLGRGDHAIFAPLFLVAGHGFGDAVGKMREIWRPFINLWPLHTCSRLETSKKHLETATFIAANETKAHRWWAVNVGTSRKTSRELSPFLLL
jgi:hypothetical protein